jgi:hypothetical protein
MSKLLNILNEELEVLSEKKNISKALQQFKDILKKKKRKALIDGEEVEGNRAASKLKKMISCSDTKSTYYDVFDLKDHIIIKRSHLLGDQQTFSIRTPTVVTGVRG